MLVQLKLFKHGGSPRSATAMAHLEAFRQNQGEGVVSLEVVDVSVHADQAEQFKVLATPTLLRLRPLPMVRILGDLSNPAILTSVLPPPARHLM